MPLKKRGDVWHIDIKHHGLRVRRSAGTTDRREAQRIHDEIKAELWAVKADGHTWQEAVIAWLKIKPRSESDRYRLRALEYADRPLHEVTAESLSKALAEQTPASHNKYRNLILATLNLAKKSGWIDAVPGLPAKETPPSRIRWLSREEWERLYAALPSHLKPLAKFAITTGLRQANVLNLEWSQVDLRRRVLWIHPDQAKAGKPIGIPLSEDAVAVLRAQQKQHEKWVFPYRGAPIGKIKTAWRKAKLRAGIENFRWHDLRHTWASWHIMAGTPLEVLKELGGWADIRMVLKYAHLSPDHLASYANNSKPYSALSEAA